MEYSFTRDDLERPVARMNMEAEAFGHWLNIELAGAAATAQLEAIAHAVDALLIGQRWDYEWRGREFLLRLSRDRAEVVANALLQRDHFSVADDEDIDSELLDDEDVEDGTGAGLSAHCGLQDFAQLIRAWRDYSES
ncbi:MAG: YacL family protein [Pseudomonadales bacterium]